MILKNIDMGGAPHVHISKRTSWRLWALAVCLLAPVLQSASTDGGSSLFVALASVGTAVFLELLCERGRLSSLADGSLIVSALVLTLLMPNRMHPACVALASLFSVLVIRRSFGGLGSNWLNPAIGGWLFVRIGWPHAFSTALSASPLSILQASVSKGLTDMSGSPLALLKIAGVKASAADTLVSDQLNDSFLSWLSAKLPAGYIDLLALKPDGIIADRGVLALMAATILIIAFGTIRSWIPLVFIAVSTALVRLWGGYMVGGLFGSGDMLFPLLSGGTLLAAFILIADPASGTKSALFMLFVAALAGALSFFLRYEGGEAYGAILAVALVNLIVPLLRIGERRCIYLRGISR